MGNPRDKSKKTCSKGCQKSCNTCGNKTSKKKPCGCSSSSSGISSSSSGRCSSSISSSECSSSSSSLSSSCDENLRVESFLGQPNYGECIVIFVLICDVCVKNFSSAPSLMLTARDGSAHFPGEMCPGFTFWMLVTPQKNLVLAMPRESFCHFPPGSPYILTLFCE